MADIFHIIITLFGNLYFIFSVQAVSFILKMIVFTFLMYHFVKNRDSSFCTANSFLMVGIIIASAFEDFAWIASLLYRAHVIGFFVKQLFVRFGWIMTIFMYQSLFLFIDNFSRPKQKVYWYQYIFLPVSATFIGCFFYLIVTCASDRTPFEICMQQWVMIYNLFVLAPCIIFEGVYNLYTTRLPKILRFQLSTLIKFFIAPYVLINIWHAYPLSELGFSIANNLAVTCFSTIISMLIIYFFVRRIIGLRFFNIHNHVHDSNSHKFNFVQDFKTVLDNLGNVKHLAEIKVLAQHFFKDALGVHESALHLFSRVFGERVSFSEADKKDRYVERFLSYYEQELADTHNPLVFLKKERIFIRDELQYTYFHSPSEQLKKSLDFLEEIQADVFVPLYEGHSIIGALIVGEDARTKQLYTDVERDEMLVFGNYVSKIINLLQNRNLNELLKQRKDMEDELYFKHNEIQQYKESIRSFLKFGKDEQSIGIAFYKNRKFMYGNQAAQDMLLVDLNKQIGDPIAQKIKDLVMQCMLYKATQTSLLTTMQGKRFVVTVIPQGDSDGAVLTLHKPEVSDVVKRLVDTIKDPSDRDYILYLETTASGKLINNLLPGSTQHLLQFKIELLKLALSKKAILLEIPDHDLMSVVDLIHYTSTREILYTLEINESLTTSDTAIKIFGMNSIFGTGSHAQSLLEKLHKKGTLFIKNIHNLDRESQENLAYFIKYGFYNLFKSERKLQADVRLIFSTDKDLVQLVHEGVFSVNLFNELRKTTFAVPRLSSLEKEDIEQLIDGLSQQALAANAVSKKLLTLSKTDKEEIMAQKPKSVHDLQKAVYKYLAFRSEKNTLASHIEFDVAYNVDDPQLIQAARLGKNSLKDKQLMTLLWEKFKCQNKMALFLGVHRSSIHRRCKLYGLE